MVEDNKIEMQTSKNVKPQAKPVQGRRPSTFHNTTKLGIKKLSVSEKTKLMRSYLNRKEILTVPQDILDANPDKHFSYINYNKLAQNGMWHENGYTVYHSQDSEGMEKENFGKDGLGGMVRRNELVLAYITKEEHEQRELEKAVMKELHNPETVFTQRQELSGFSPSATRKEVTETV